MSIDYTSDVGEVSRRMRTGERIMVLVAMGYGKLCLKCLGGESIQGHFLEVRTVTNDQAHYGFVVALQTMEDSCEDPREICLSKVEVIEGITE